MIVYTLTGRAYKMMRWKSGCVLPSISKDNICDTCINLLPYLQICFNFKTFCLRTSSYDPLEKAFQENKQLIAAYRERTQNSNKGKRNRDVIARVRKQDENCKLKKKRPLLLNMSPCVSLNSLLQLSGKTK